MTTRGSAEPANKLLNLSQGRAITQGAMADRLDVAARGGARALRRRSGCSGRPGRAHGRVEAVAGPP
jgi:hypothetical protein